jgi:hypothetical protein
VTFTIFLQLSSLSHKRRSNALLSQTRHRQRERHITLSQTVTNTFADLNIIGQPSARRPYTEPVQPVSFGPMNTTCSHCGAFHWLLEHVKNSLASAPQFSHCCHHGKVRPGILPHPPERLRELFTADTSEAKHFRNVIRQYNCALAFTSFSAKESNDNSQNHGPWVWKSGYTIYHRVGSLIPDAVRDAKYAQLYFYDPGEALDI